MGYVLEPGRWMQQEVRRVAADRLDGAIERLDLVLSDPTTVDVEHAVHEVRKRCKASRGLARLVKPALGDEFAAFDRAVRDAARQLSTLRDAHAVAATFDAVLASRPDDIVLATMRDRHVSMSLGETRAATSADDDRISTARALLAGALDGSQAWRIPRGFDTIEAGLAATYRQGRSSLRRAQADPTDRRLHEWRKSAKYLWYQAQLLHDAAPSILGPLVDELDRLGDALGNDHDLAVLVHLLDERADEYGTPHEVAHVRELARRRQQELRTRALRAGCTIYAEPDDAFVRRMATYWEISVERGPELPTGGLDVLVQPSDAPTRSTVERERKFLVDRIPDGIVSASVVELRQGYLATDERRSVRVRDAGSDGCTITVKAGSGAERTELEWPIDRIEFEAAWPHVIEGARIEKSRHRIPYGGHTIELDVFGGDLDGLVMAEVEFSSSEAMAAFTAPEWFGREVTDDGRYTNASLALHGLPPPTFA